MRGPLARPAFFALFLAAITSNIGSFFEEVGHAWLMVSLTGDPLPVALIATATTAPGVLLTLPAGILADRFDRLTLLVVSQLLASLVAAALALATATGHVSPGAILGACAGFSVAGSLASPAWLTLVPELVPREETAEAVAMNSLAFNVARAVGPALGGVLLAWAGATWAFALNAASFLVLVIELRRHPEIAAASRAATVHVVDESLRDALVGPLRAVARSERLRAPFVAIVLVAVPSAATYSLLPALGKHVLGASERGLGALIAAYGVGAVAGALSLRRLRVRLGPRRLLSVGLAVYGLGLVAASLAPSLLVASLVLVPTGAGWVTVSILNAALQLAAPPDAKARVMAAYQVAFLFAWSIGAVLGGFVARAWGERDAGALGGVGVVLSAFAVAALPLPRRDAELHAPAASALSSRRAS